MIGINLIPAPRRELSARRRRVFAWSLTLTAYALLLAAAGFGAASLLGNAPGQITELQSARDRLTLREQQLKSAAAEALALDRKLVAARLIAEHPDWSVLSRLIAERRAEGVMLDSLSVSPDRSDRRPDKPGIEYIVRIDGAGLSQRAVSEYVASLEHLGLFASVRQLESRVRTVENAQMVGFQLECRIDSRARPGAPK